jgi:RNA polymerase sigma factor for flagellar operon FliA
MMSAPAKTSEQLIAECQGLVRSIALKIHRSLPDFLDIEDSIAYGQIGLAEAARDFDPAQGHQFSTYAYYRIRGAIYDGLSKMSWVSRSQYQRLRCEQMAGEALLDDATSSASGETSLEDDARWLTRLSSTLAVVYLSTRSEDDTSPGSNLSDDSSPPPEEVVAEREISVKLRELIDSLPEEAGKLIRAAYFEGLTLQEAGQRLGIGKSWASRLHAKTLQRLGRSLRLLGLADCGR